MKRLDLKPGKIADVECQNPADAVHVHHGHKPRIVHLGTNDGISDDEVLPFFVNRWGIRQKVSAVSILATSLRAKVGENPRPLAAMGRVITFQNSETF